MCYKADSRKLLIFRSVFRISCYRCYRFATTSLVQLVHRRLVPHGEPSPVGVHGELDAGVAELPLNVHRALPLLEEQLGVGVSETAPVGVDARSKEGPCDHG